ncbi:poly(A) RNA polymerase gld-2 homolog B isoform X1 [Drosophila bipectinata]|uniref:poly(A) RNA polymerase gld-2 homolog B isoform X1 n=1 Tax=Drosophila bipectinata TaxID=42026 RepID=UPI001C89B61B|nr:poly(A) RNA polymerase gld-2 homolog B [Drosophila bipectinata]
MHATFVASKMKIFAADVVVDSSKPASTSVQQQKLTQQQREFRQRLSAGSPIPKTGQCQLKFPKYNGKTGHLLRQVTSYHNNNNSGSNNNNIGEVNKQHQSNHYSNNSSSMARKKHFDNTNNNNSEQQQQSSYYQPQQHQLNNNNHNNNNNLLMKNKNIIEQPIPDCKISDSNSSKMQSKPVKWLNGSSNSTKINVNCNISCSNNNKKRNSLPTSAEVTSAYYRGCPSSLNCELAEELEATSKSSTADPNTTHGSHPASKPSQPKEPRVEAEELVAVGFRRKEQEQLTQEATKQRPLQQQPLSFWKTNYSQPAENQIKDKQVIPPPVSRSADHQQQQQQRPLSFEHRRNSGYHSHQQQNYYQYYYPQPKQLTIASFLQKELFPDSSDASSQQNGSGTATGNGTNNANASANNNVLRQQNTHQSVGSDYSSQRYRNSHYAQYQQYQHHHNPQHHHPHQYGMNSSHFRRKHADSHGQSCNNNKKAPGGSGESYKQHPHQMELQNTIEILASSNVNAMHRRMHGGEGKNGYYQHYHPLMAEHQNLYNLTYINVDISVPSSDPAIGTEAGLGTGASAGSKQLGVKSSLLVKPSITLTTISTPPPVGGGGHPIRSLPTPITASVRGSCSASLPTPTLGHSIYVTSPNAFPVPINGHAVLSPVATTPTNMISCAQLDEEITAAAASGSGDLSSVQNPSYPPTVPYMLTHQQSHPQRLHLVPPTNNAQPPQPPQPVFFHFGDGYNSGGSGTPSAVWSHPGSACYQASFGSSVSSSSNHSKDVYSAGLRPVSPALSSCSLGSDSHWSCSNRSRLGQGDLSISGQLSPHLVEISGPRAPLPKPIYHSPLPQPPPPPPLYHTHSSVHGPINVHGMPTYGTLRPQPLQVSSPTPPVGALGASWYDLVLPPDRYLAQARNIEIVTQPEQLVCLCKYDDLSVEIWKRFRDAQQTHKKFKVKMRLWRYLFLWMNQPMFERYRICLVGSTITGFGTDSSDIDMCLLPEQLTQRPQSQHQMQHQFHNEKRTDALLILSLINVVLKDTEVFQDFNLIEARVPILRFKDTLNGIEVDLNFNNCVGIKNTYLLQLYAQLDWRTRPLVVIVKLWAQYHDINDAKRMTISSYSLVLMVLHYLQYGCIPHVLPCLHSLYPEKFHLDQQDCLDLDLIEPIEPYQTHNTQALGEHLLGFFKYYSNFDFRNYAISIRTGGVLPVSTCRLAKSQKNDVYQWKELNIEEPFDLSNTARSVYDYATFERVKYIFVTSGRRLEHTLDLASIFRPIANVHNHHNHVRSNLDSRSRTVSADSTSSDIPLGLGEATSPHVAF